MYSPAQILSYRNHEKCKYSSCHSKFANAARFNILRDCKITHSTFIRKLSIKNTNKLSIESLEQVIGRFFNIRAPNIIVTKQTLHNRVVVSIDFILRFESFNQFHDAKTVLLPSNWTLNHKSNSENKNNNINRSNLIDIFARHFTTNNTPHAPDVLAWDNGISLVTDNTHTSPASTSNNQNARAGLRHIHINNHETANSGRNLNIVNAACDRQMMSALQSFNTFLSCFNFCHSNVQGLLEGAHFDQLNNLISKFNCLSLIAISETFLRASNTNKSVEIDGYKLIRADRVGRKNDRNKGGGVAVYLKTNFKYKIILNSFKNNHGFKFIDFLVLEISTKYSKITFGVLYRTKDCTNGDARNFFDLLCNTVQRDANVIITGDFNINFLNTRLNLVNIMNNFAYKFTRVNDNCPTHFWPGKNPSQIDLIFTNNINKIKYFGHFPSGISFHDMLVCSYNILSDNKNKNITVASRDYKNINLTHLKSAVRELDWNFNQHDNIDDKVRALNNNILNLLNRFAPIKTRRFKHEPKAWFNNDIKSALEERRVSYDNWKNSISDVPETVAQLESVYRETNKKVKKLINKSKKAIFVNNFNSAASNKEKWSLIASEGCLKDANNDDDDILNNFNLNDINNHFASIHSSAGANPNSININNPPQNSFSFREINNDDFYAAYKSIKSNAVGDDNIPLKFLKLIINEIANSIISVFNFCIKESVYPSLWNSIVIKPLNKITNPQSISDFRPISIISVIAKIFAIILNNQIVYHLESESLLHGHQSGFRRHFSCTTALLKISENIRKSINERKSVIYLSLDIKSAFPSVPHDALFTVCEQAGFSDSAIKLVKGVFNNIHQKVKVGNKFSNTININNGVLQGRNFDQTFFLLYFNDILNITEHLNGFLFADDYQAILPVDFKNINNGINLVNADLVRINEWLNNRGLKLNTSKSKVMIIGTKAQTDKINFETIPSITIGAEKLEYCKHIKNLGVIFDENMSFEKHNDAKIQKIYGNLNRIRHTKNCIPNYVKRDIATAIIDSIFNYGDIISYGWGIHGTNSDDDRLLIADNDKIRYIYGLKRRDHITGYREKLYALKPDERAQLNSATLIYNQLVRQTPAYLNDMFVRNTNNTRAGINGKLRAIKPRSEHDKKQFCFSAINFWNSIPSDITALNTVKEFKINLKSWIISKRV